jgi:hypothetical protein
MRSLFLACHVLLLMAFCGPLMAEPAKGLSDYVRYTKGSPSKLETAIVRWKGPRGQQLDLISAVHIADAAYYKELNSRFQGYDALLYEMILPEEMAGQALPAMEASGGVSGIQGMLGRALGLTTQIERIDYSARNFVHADLTREGLERSMKARQESFLTYFQKLLLNSSNTQADLGVTEQELSELDLMAILSGMPTAKDRRVLKKMMATVMTSSDGMGALNDTALLAERNKAALKALDGQLAAGKKRLGLFYGAAHMPDLEARLREKGWTRGDTSWLQAWTI